MFARDGWVEFNPTLYVEIEIYPIVFICISHVLNPILVHSHTSQDMIE